ncbi:FAN1 nuclease, partial [Amia calva]|nr:FAN1 nuclease [Amia calva]
MAEGHSPGKGRQRRSLSLKKNKKTTTTTGGRDSVRPGSQRTGSILSFFNNAPPARLACPICGEMVPRFCMNQHIDNQCEQFCKEEEESKSMFFVSNSSQNPVRSLEITSPPPPPPPRTPEKTPSRCAASSLDQADASPSVEKEKKQSSPYFKKLTLSVEAREVCSQAKVVRVVDLGCLASKLSRKRQKLDLGSQQSLAHTSATSPDDSNITLEEAKDTGALSSSQKENQYVQLSSTVPGRFEGNDDLTSLGVQGAPGDDGCKGPGIFTVDLKGPGTHRTKAPESQYETSSSAAVASTQSVPTLRSSRSRSRAAPRADASLPTLSHRVRSSCKRQRNKGSTNPANQASAPFSAPPRGNEDGNTTSQKMATAMPAPKEGHKEAEYLGAGGGTNTPVESASAADSLGGAPVTGVGSSNGGVVPESPRLPYYLRNFLSVLEAVLENEDDRQLFNQDDIRTIDAFRQLSVAGQKLYVRLFQRKLHWLKVNKLDYPEIGPDLSPGIQELVKCGFLQTESELQELTEVLELLPAPELKALAKTFHLAGPGAQKQQLTDALLRLSRQRPLFSLGRSQHGTATVILRRAKELAGACVRVCRAPRAVFSRLLLLFSLTDGVEEEEAGAGGQGQLYTVLMVNMGRLTFPTYTVQRRARVFRDRDDLIRYEEAARCLAEVMGAMQSGAWEEARLLYDAAKTAWQDLSHTADLRHEEDLPVFLRCFTAGWAYIRVRSRGVEILQRLKLYEEAVEELRSLLAQSVYCPDSRGRWWDRLALNLQQHLKRTEEAIDCIKAGLSDPLVRTGHQLSLYQRAVRLRESPSCRKFRLLLRDIPAVEVKDVPHVTIRGRMCPQSGMGKSVFLMQEEEEEEEGVVVQDGGDRGDAPLTTVMCSVEELALAHYRRQGFPQGIHGEGSTFSTLYGLLLWDIIYMDGIADVFRNPYQSCPLDLNTDCFYENRRATIEARLELLQEASTETLQALLADTWCSQEGKASTLVNWERFSSLQQAQSLVACLGGPFLSGLVRRMAGDYRHCRGGLPDLVVWNTDNNSCKLVEVKGPSDRLSQKQMIWLDELQKLGAEVEVCHVTDVGARGKRLS